MKKKDPSINTIIGENSIVNGDIKLAGNIIVNGKVTGDIETEGTIRVLQGAVIIGKLVGKDLHIGGQVEGNVIASGKVVLGDRSMLRGDVSASQIVIEEGAQFEGKCDMQSRPEIQSPVKSGNSEILFK